MRFWSPGDFAPAKPQTVLILFTVTSAPLKVSRIHKGTAMATESGSGWHVSPRRIAGWAAAVALILLIPLVAMQFSDEWNWNLFDFIFAGTLLFGAALTYELVAKKGAATAYRGAVGVAVATALALIWVNAAVGVIGDDESFNLMYFGVLAVGIVGALVARLRPRGMACALLAMAVAQMLVPVIVLAIPNLRGALFEPPGVVGVFGLNAFFAMLWIGSAWLFRKAAQGRTPTTAAAQFDP